MHHSPGSLSTAEVSKNHTIRPDGGLVRSHTGLLTWVCFDVVHLVEIFRDKKLLQTNTHKKQVSNQTTTQCPWLLKGVQILNRNQKFEPLLELRGLKNATYEKTGPSPARSPQRRRCPGLWRCVCCHGGRTCRSTVLEEQEQERQIPQQPHLYPPEHRRLTYMRLCGRCWASTDRCLASAKLGWFWGERSDLINQERVLIVSQQ